jgi:hypothetical protein
VKRETNNEIYKYHSMVNYIEQRGRRDIYLKTETLDGRELPIGNSINS